MANITGFGLAAHFTKRTPAGAAYGRQRRGWGMVLDNALALKLKGS
jgi:hypothetical protein